MKSVRVKVPATSANLGPGFDCLGMALKLHNELELTLVEEGLQLEIEGYGSDRLPRDDRNLIIQGVRRLYQLRGEPFPGIHLRATNAVPVGSGLGSSAAALVGGLACANHLTGEKLSKQDLLQLALEMEGHADNAAAAIFGGLNLIALGGGSLVARQIPVVELMAVVAVPEVDLPTQQLRGVLPKRIPLADAVFNMSRMALTLEALRTGDYDLLGCVMEDRLHEPHRKGHLPAYDTVVAAAREAGAAAVVLSGAGPSMIAFAPEHHYEIGEAMVSAYLAAGWPARSFVLPLDRDGLQVRSS